jgi:hypothetical protein
MSFSRDRVSWRTPSTLTPRVLTPPAATPTVSGAELAFLPTALEAHLGGTDAPLAATTVAAFTAPFFLPPEAVAVRLTIRLRGFVLAETGTHASVAICVASTAHAFDLSEGTPDGAAWFREMMVEAVAGSVLAVTIVAVVSATRAHTDSSVRAVLDSIDVLLEAAPAQPNRERGETY